MTVHVSAEEAAIHWSGHVLRLLSHRENAVFEMATPAGRAALRLHRPGYQTAEAIHSELWWTAQLAYAGLRVPRPMPARDGRMLVHVTGDLLASAVCWVDGAPMGVTGAPLEAPLSVLFDQHKALGRSLAMMHVLSDTLTLPNEFTRQRWDAAGLVGETPVWGRFWTHPAATGDQRKILIRARDGLREWLQGFSGDFGLIHADVLRENIFVNDDSLTLIDFDDSGFGYRLYDLGTAMLGNLSEPAYPALLEALISGYSEVRPADPHSVEMFILARTCASVGWTMPRLPQQAPVNQSHIARCVTLAERLIR